MLRNRNEVVKLSVIIERDEDGYYGFKALSSQDDNTLKQEAWMSLWKE